MIVGGGFGWIYAVFVFCTLTLAKISSFQFEIEALKVDI